MNISKARKITGYEKCDFDAYDDKCSCGRKQDRYNSENYIRTSYVYDEGDYACNTCVIKIAKAINSGVHI